MNKKTKKKIEKIVISPVKGVVFNNDDKVKELNNLILSQGWKILLEALDVNIEYMGEQIMSKYDSITKKAITDLECDLIRFKRSAFKELKQFPNTLINTLSSKPETVFKNYDPYLDVKDIKDK